MATFDQIALKLFGSIGIIIVILFCINLLFNLNSLRSPDKIHEWLITPFTMNENSVIFGVNPGLNIGYMTMTRWDVFYLFRWVFGLLALVYCSYCIQDIMTYPMTHPCMQRDAFIRDLFISFIFFTMILFFVNTLSAYQLSYLLNTIMQYAVPLAALILSALIVYYSDKLSKLAPYQLVE
jgi:hypothetical protein